LTVGTLLEIGLTQIREPAALAPIDERRQAELPNAEVVAEGHRVIGAFRAVELLVASAIRIEAIERNDFVRRVADLHLRARCALAEAAARVECRYGKRDDHTAIPRVRRVRLPRQHVHLNRNEAET